MIGNRTYYAFVSNPVLTYISWISLYLQLLSANLNQSSASIGLCICLTIHGLLSCGCIDLSRWRGNVVAVIIKIVIPIPRINYWTCYHLYGCAYNTITQITTCTVLPITHTVTRTIIFTWNIFHSVCFSNRIKVQILCTEKNMYATKLFLLPWQNILFRLPKFDWYSKMFCWHNKRIFVT